MVLSLYRAGSAMKRQLTLVLFQTGTGVVNHGFRAPGHPPSSQLPKAVDSIPVNLPGEGVDNLFPVNPPLSDTPVDWLH